MISIRPALIDVQAAGISDRASPTSVRDDGSFDDDAVTEKPAARPDIPSSMIDDIDARLEIRSSIPEIRDARAAITARRIENKAEGTDVHDARISGHADGIDEQAEVIDEHDALIEIRDDRTSFIDTAPDEPAERMDPRAERDEERGDAIDDGEGRTNRSARPIDLRAGRT